MKKITILIAIAMATQIAIAQQPFLYAPELFNPKVSAGVCGFSEDGKTIYYVQEDTLQEKLFLYYAVRKNNQWVNPQLMPFSGNYNDLGGRLSKDGKEYYFTSDRPGGSSNPDDVWNIWHSTQSNGEWIDPKPLLELNNKGNECCPLPAYDDKNALIFSADREKATSWWISRLNLSTGEELFMDSLNGDRLIQWPSFFVDSNTLLLNSMRRTDSFGMDDIYISFKKNGVWSKPLNVGVPINSKVYEDGAILTPDKKHLIFLRHDTHETPSRVMAVEWEPVIKKLRR